jgi:DNA-binding NarL/FixJ family response regulator
MWCCMGSCKIGPAQKSRPVHHGVAFAPDHWNRLERNELQAAAREQLGLNRSDIAIQPSISEGTVMGHVNSVMDRFAVVDRGVSFAAVREMPGQELANGLILGSGMVR